MIGDVYQSLERALHTEWGQILLLAALAVVVVLAARTLGFFSFPIHRGRVEVSLASVLGGFLTVLVTIFFVVPLVVALALIVFEGVPVDKLGAALEETDPLYDAVVPMAGAAMAVLFVAWLNPEVRRGIWWGRNRPTAAAFRTSAGMGLAGLFVALPVVSTVGAMAMAVMKDLGFNREAQQVAVETVRHSLEGSSLVAPLFAILAVVVAAPLLEEILYRGLVQSFLEQHLSRNWAIGWTAGFFAVSHFNMAQGARNVELLLALFVFGCFLGIIYERQRVLWSSIVMHASFNVVGVCRLLLQS